MRALGDHDRKNDLRGNSCFQGRYPHHILAKPIGPACNLACRYCYYPQGETPVEKMNESTLEVFICRY
ncbi:hypothetical protein MJO10_29605, partial [Salmonella enterica subsp. enterica serovar Anatum]|nr:hypothetical protein [Salmonella enterica subsp. enterica serovar Anatum]